MEELEGRRRGMLITGECKREEGVNKGVSKERVRRRSKGGKKE